MDAAREIQLIRHEVEQAAEAFISAADRGLELVAQVREGRPDALSALEKTFLAILEACAFQDLMCQRLSRLDAASGVLTARRSDDPLLQGPADRGAGLGQDAADRLFAGE
jgi:hypothetical protein